MTKQTNSTRLAVMENEIKGINKSLENHVTEQREDFTKLNDKLDELKESFAGKWVEKLNIGILIAVIGGLLLFGITKINGG